MKLIHLRGVTPFKEGSGYGVPHTSLAVGNLIKLPIKDGSIELMSQPLTMAFSVHPFLE